MIPSGLRFLHASALPPGIENLPGEGGRQKLAELYYAGLIHLSVAIWIV